MPKHKGTQTRKIISTHKLYDPRVKRGSRTSHVVMLECKHLKKVPPEKLAALAGKEMECMVCPPVQKFEPAPVKKTVVQGITSTTPKHDPRLLDLMETLVAQNAQLTKRLEQLENAVTAPAELRLEPVGVGHGAG